MDFRRLVPLLVLAGCAAPTEEAPTMSPAMASEPRAHGLAGAMEHIDTVKGKVYRMQEKFDADRLPVAQMLYQDGVPLVLNEYTTKNKKITNIRSTWYNPDGTALFISEQEIKQQSRLGRCLQLLLPNELLAQTQLTQCPTERYQANSAATQVKLTFSAALWACGAAGFTSVLPACVLAVGFWIAAQRDYNFYLSAYNACMARYAGTTGTSGGTSGTITETVNVPVGGGSPCYDVFKNVYNASHQLISSTYVTTVCK